MAMEFHDEHYFDVVVRSRQSHRLNNDARGWNHFTSILAISHRSSKNLSRLQELRLVPLLVSRRCFQGNQIADSPSSEPGIKGATFLHIPFVLCKC